MSTLGASVYKSINESLMKRLPAHLAKEHNLDENEVKESFLTKELGKSATSRGSGKKGTNGKGPISGFIHFSNQNRQKLKEDNPDLKFTEIGALLGKMWKALEDSEKETWNSE